MIELHCVVSKAMAKRSNEVVLIDDNPAPVATDNQDFGTGGTSEIEGAVHQGRGEPISDGKGVGKAGSVDLVKCRCVDVPGQKARVQFEGGLRHVVAGKANKAFICYLVLLRLDEEECQVTGTGFQEAAEHLHVLEFEAGHDGDCGKLGGPRTFQKGHEHDEAFNKAIRQGLVHGVAGAIAVEVQDHAEAICVHDLV